MKTIKKKIQVPDILKSNYVGVSLPTTVQHIIISYSWNSNKDYKYLLSLSLVCRKWFEITCRLFNESTMFTDDMLKDPNFLKHIVQSQPKSSLIQGFSKMVAIKYIPLSTSNSGNNIINSTNTTNLGEYNKQEQIQKINKILFGSLESLECEISGSGNIPSNYFEPIVNGLKSQDRQLTSFIFRNTANNLLYTFTSLNLVTRNLTELSINTTHIKFDEFNLTAFIHDRAATLKTLTLSLFYDKVNSIPFYERTLNQFYPMLESLHFGTIDYTQPMNWSVINRQNFPRLSDVGFYWTSASRNLDTEYNVKFIECIKSYFKRIHTTLNLSPLMIDQLSHNTNVEKWKFRIFRHYDTISFNPVVKKIAITFTQKFNQESTNDESDTFMVSLFDSFSGQARLDYLSLWNVKPNFVPLLMRYLDSESARSLTYFGFSLSTYTAGTGGYNYAPLIEILVRLPFLHTLEFTDVAMPEQVEQIERIIQLSESVKKVYFIHSSALHEPTGLSSNDRLIVKYGGKSYDTTATSSPPTATPTKSSGFCKTQ